jgi:hypothetical protein
MMRVTMLAAGMLFFCIESHAGMITQPVQFDYKNHASSNTNYARLNPALAPLNSVVFSVTATGTSGPWMVTNPTSGTLTFNVIVDQTIETDAGSHSLVTSMPVTLAPSAIQQVPVTETTSDNLVQTTNLSSYIGTSTISPFGFYNGVVFADNPLITVSYIPDIGGGVFQEIKGSETVAYYYGNSFFVPEPASFTMLSLSLAAVAVRAWRRRSGA